MPERTDARILLVDDDLAKRYTIAKTLTLAGFEVYEAGSGAEALRLVASLPDLVILDVKLPDIDGFEVCRRIKSDPATAAIPVLHISTTFVAYRRQGPWPGQRCRRLLDQRGRADGADRHGARPAARPMGRGCRATLLPTVADHVRCHQ